MIIMKTFGDYNDFNFSSYALCVCLPLQELRQNVRLTSFSVETVAASRLSGSVMETRTAQTAAMRIPVVRK